MDWLLSGMTVVTNFLLGKKSIWGWLTMLLMNGMWISYALHLNPPQYGLLPAIILNSIIAIYSARKWFKEKGIK